MFHAEGVNEMYIPAKTKHWDMARGAHRALRLKYFESLLLHSHNILKVSLMIHFID